MKILAAAIAMPKFSDPGRDIKRNMTKGRVCCDP
jgi:hypothetical protein